MKIYLERALRHYAAMQEYDEFRPERISKRLLWFRKYLGIERQKDFADSIGTTATAYNNWEKDRYLSLDGALKIASRYGLSLDFLFLNRLDTLSAQMRNSWLEYDRDSATSSSKDN